MKTKLLIAMTSALVLSSCGSKDSQVPAVAAPAVSTPAIETRIGTNIEKDSVNGDWQIKEMMTRDGDVYFKWETLPADKAEEYARKEYRSTQMKQVPVDPSYNAQLFRIEGEDSNKAVYIAPKIYAYSGNEANKMEPLIDDERGTMTLFFPIVFIDGLKDTIESPNQENGMIKLPANWLVQNKDSLLKFLNKQFARYGEQNLASLPGCPKRIIMTVAGEEYDIAKSILQQADYCQYNKPIYTSITLPKSKALWLLQEGLYTGAAKISAIFETRVPYTVSKLRIEMNKQKLYEEIAARIEVNHPYAEVELTTEIQKIVRKQAMKISIQGNLNEQLSSIVNQAIAHFFEKMPADPARANLKCGSALTCFKLSYKKQDFEDNFSVEWLQTSDVLSGQNILTWTGLNSLFDDSVQIVDVQNNGTKRTTGLTLYDGALLELKVNSLVVEQVKQTQKSVRTNNNVQIGTTPVRDCREMGNAIAINPRLLSAMGEGGGGGNAGREGIGGGHRDHCGTTKKPVFENQWYDTVTLGYETSNETVLNPNGKADEVLNNVGFEFQWNENGKTVTRRCPANLFGRYGDGKSILIKIENVPGCEVFSKNSSNRPILALYNDSTKKAEGIKVGYKYVNWLGQITRESYSPLDYTLKSIYSGTIMRRGSIRTDVNSRPGINLL